MTSIHNHNWEYLCREVRKIAAEAAKYIATERKRFTADKVETKGAYNFVSYVDKGAEALIVEALEHLLPEAAFVAEEGSGRVDEAAPYQWIIDPLDGTTNFVHGMPPYAVSIALWDTQTRETVVGVVHEVTLDESFYSWQGANKTNVKPNFISISSYLCLWTASTLRSHAYSCKSISQ